MLRPKQKQLDLVLATGMSNVQASASNVMRKGKGELPSMIKNNPLALQLIKCHQHGTHQRVSFGGKKSSSRTPSSQVPSSLEGCHHGSRGFGFHLHFRESVHPSAKPRPPAGAVVRHRDLQVKKPQRSPSKVVVAERG